MSATRPPEGADPSPATAPAQTPVPSAGALVVRGNLQRDLFRLGVVPLSLIHI